MGQLIHARNPVPPRRRVELGGSVVLALFAGLELFTGSWRVAIGAAAGAVLMIPLAYFAAGKAAGQHPDWIEVRPDGITALRASGTSWELVRNADSVLRVQEARGRPVLLLDGMTSTGTIPLARFDIDEVRATATAAGWRWSPGGSTTFPTSATTEWAAPAGKPERGTRIVLRDGRRGPLPWAKNGFSPRLVVAFSVIVAMGVLALAFASASPTVIMIAVFGPSLLLAAALVTLSIRHTLRVTLTVTVSPDRVTVTHGTLASQVVQRTAVTASRIGRRYVRLRGPEGKPLLYVPLNPQRTAVLNALSANGWPV